MTAAASELPPEATASITVNRDDTLGAVVTLATEYVVQLTDIAASERTARPGLSAVLYTVAEEHAGRVLELVRRWPS
jgi:hypothetical protein